jgi:hypothetical protein
MRTGDGPGLDRDVGLGGPNVASDQGVPCSKLERRAAARRERAIRRLTHGGESTQDATYSASIGEFLVQPAGGIEFIDENGGGPGVRLRKPDKPRR